MTSWNEVRADLNTHQRLRFAMRADDDYRLLNAIMRPHMEEKSADPLHHRLLQLFAANEQLRLVAMVGGPASGKSYTAWKVFSALDAAPAQLAPFYLPLAYVPFEQRRFADLYEAAYFIHHELVNYQTIFDSSYSYEMPPTAQLFILDDASFASQAVTRNVIRRHLKNHPADRILLLLQEQPAPQSFGLRPDQMVTVQLKGLHHYRNPDRLRRIDDSKASWPMVDDVLGKCRFDRDPGSSVEFYQKLQAYAFTRSAAGSTHENFMALAATVLGGPLFLLWHPLRFSPDWTRYRGIAIDEQGNVGGYPYQFLFTYSARMGLAFANTATASYVVAMWRLERILAEGNEGMLLTSGIIHQSDSLLLSKITVAAYIDTLIHRLSYDQETRAKRSLELITNIADSLLYPGSYRQLLYPGSYRPILLQLGKLLRQVDHSVNYYQIGGISGNEGNVAVGSAIAQGYGGNPDTVATLLARLERLLQSGRGQASTAQKVEIKQCAEKLLAAL